MSSRSVFTPSHSALDAIFATGTSYTIPSYQRPYSWQCLGKNDRTSQVNQMWEDLWSFFEATRKATSQDTDKEYFLGSMVVIGKGDRQFEVIDGQQRLTTLTLLFAAMRCFLQEVLTAKSPFADFLQSAIQTVDTLLFNQRGVGLTREKKVKIERASGFDYDSLLMDAISCKALPPKVGRDAVADRYYLNRDFFIDQLRDRFLVRGEFTEERANTFDQFFRFLYTRVSIVLITTADFDTAYFIFETLNNRGLPLSAKDLLRNFLIKELTEAREADPPRMWVELEANHTLTEEFISRWVESRRAAQQRTSAFNELTKVYRELQVPPGGSRARIFYEMLRHDLGYYSMIMEPDQRIDNLTIRNKINFIRAMGNERYSVNLLLSVFRSCDYQGDDNPLVRNILTVYQRWMLYVLLAPGVRFSNTNVYDAIRVVNERALDADSVGRVTTSSASFALSDGQIDTLLKAIEGPIRDNDTAKLVLAGIVWNQEVAQGNDDLVMQHLRYNEATLEHILPQTPAPGSRWLVDFTDSERQDLTYFLGNMTLLTRKWNSSARNEDFHKKKANYVHTNLWLTRDLATRPIWTPRELLDRHRRLTQILKVELGL